MLNPRGRRVCSLTIAKLGEKIEVFAIVLGAHGLPVPAALLDWATARGVTRPRR
jgi:hypothetical protein